MLTSREVAEPKNKKICVDCKNETTRLQRIFKVDGTFSLRAYWYNIGINQWLCRTCYQRQWQKKKSVVRIAKRKREYDKRECYACGGKTTHMKYGTEPQWYLNPPIGVICNNCYSSIFRIEYTRNWWKSESAKLLNAKRHFSKHEDDILRYYNRRGKIFTTLNEFACRQCGESDWRCLQLDHINGGGSFFRNKCGGQSNMYSFYIKNPDIAKRDLQVLCANCNIKKRFANGENRKFIEKIETIMEEGD